MVAASIGEAMLPPPPGTGTAIAVGDLDHWSMDLRGTQSPGGPVVDETTLFDLASLTKVMVTVPLALQAMASGAVEPETQLRHVSNRLADAPIGQVTLAQLLTHTSGAPPDMRLGRSLEESLAQIHVGTKGEVVYSDAGFIALGHMLELASDTPLTQLAQDFATDLGADQSDVAFFEVEPSRWASTDPDNPGRVHDPTARRAGRLLGHAGCFATITGARRLLDFWLVPTPALSPLVALASRHQSGHHSSGRRGWGWSLQGDGYACAAGWPATTVSHTGFTGTAVAFVPEGGYFSLVLSNSVADDTGASLRWLRSTMRSLAPSQDESHKQGTVPP